MRATYAVYLLVLDMIILIIYGEDKNVKALCYTSFSRLLLPASYVQTLRHMTIRYHVTFRIFSNAVMLM
jgi:hypothetical protein